MQLQNAIYHHAKVYFYIYVQMLYRVSQKKPKTIENDLLLEFQ